MNLTSSFSILLAVALLSVQAAPVPMQRANAAADDLIWDRKRSETINSRGHIMVDSGPKRSNEAVNNPRGHIAVDGTIEWDRKRSGIINNRGHITVDSESNNDPRGHIAADGTIGWERKRSTATVELERVVTGWGRSLEGEDGGEYPNDPRDRDMK